MTELAMTLGKYRLERKLGAGGMGEVWEARDTILDRAVAVKLLTGDAADREHYVREAAAAARVNHPNTVTVHDAAEISGRWFIVMELVRGPNTGQLVEQRGPLPWREATRIIRDAAAGLAAVHAAGLIHRDIKPGNILLSEQGQAKIADFGLARHSARTSCTTTGSLLGTPHFMSPERCQGEPADARSDVYALGATYYALLTGHPPYDGENQMAIMFAHCNNPVSDPRTRVPDLPEGCAAIVRQAMAKQPSSRFPTADAMRASLDDALVGGAKVTPTSVVTPRLPPATAPLPSPRSHGVTRRAWLAAIPAAAAGLAGAAYFGWRPRRDDVNSPPPQVLFAPWTGPWDMKGPVAHLAISADAQAVAIAVEDRADDGKNRVELLDRAGRSWRGWPKSGRGAESVAFSADAKLLAAAFRGWGRVQLWEVSSGSEVGVEGSEDLGLASAVAFAADGQWLAAASYADPRAQIQIWHRDGGAWRRKHTVRAAEAQVWGFAFAPVGNFLAVGSGTEGRAALELFDPATATKSPGPRFTPRRERVGPCLAFAVQKPVLAVGSLGEVRLFALPTWEPQGSLALPERKTDVRVVALSADGTLVAAAQDQQIIVLRASGGEPLDTIRRDAPVTALAFAPDGPTLISGGEDGVVRVHTVPDGR